jgi:hypothetical protein
MAKANVRLWLPQPGKDGFRLRVQARLKGGRWIKTMKDMIFALKRYFRFS